MSAIELCIRKKAYPDSSVPVLHDVVLKAERGQFVAIVGPSGAGKSTLLNIVGGLDRDFDGEIALAGVPQRAGARRALSCGFVFQEPRLMPWLSVLDNLRLVLSAQPDATAKATRILGEVGLADCAHQFPGQLSGGMQRRVALARAFVIQPALLLLDEPFVSLDAPTATRLREQLLRLYAAYRPTVLLVTHDLREALALAGRLIFFSGRPARVLLDCENRVPHTGDPQDPEITRVHDQLLHRHPGLLSGLALERVGPGHDEPTLWKTVHRP